MKILIAGGAGYIGSKLVPVLQDRGYEVDVIDLFIFGNELPQSTKLIKKNIFDLTEQDISKYDIVIFMAGLSNDPMAEFSPAANFVFNTACPVFLSYLSKKAKIKKFIYASSCSVYGYTEDKLYDENSPTTVQYPYGISKLQGELGIMQLVDDNFNVICLRQGTVCGYSPRMRLDLVINTMFKTAMSEGVIRVSNPSIWRPILWIEDAVTAFIRAIEANSKISGVFNVASFNCTTGSLADDIKNTLESVTDKKIKIEIQNIQDFRNYKVSIDKARHILSFHPKGLVKDIIIDLYNNRDKFTDLNNPKYKNIEVFREWLKKESPSLVPTVN